MFNIQRSGNRVAAHIDHSGFSGHFNIETIDAAMYLTEDVTHIRVRLYRDTNEAIASAVEEFCEHDNHQRIS